MTTNTINVNLKEQKENKSKTLIDLYTKIAITTCNQKCFRGASLDKNSTKYRCNCINFVQQIRN